MDKMNICDAEIIFADDQQALEQAYLAGAPRAAKVYTASPAMLLNPANDFIQHDADASVSRMMALGEETRACSAALYKTVFEHTNIHGQAVVAARHPLTVQNSISKAMSLKSDVLEKRILVTQAKTGDARRDSIINTPWQRLIPNDAAVEIFSANVAVPPTINSSSDPVAPFLERLKFEGLQSVGYRLGERFAAYAPWFPARGEVWVAHESSLLKETAFHLFKRGYRIRAIPKIEIETPQDIDADLLEACKEIYVVFLDKTLDRAVSQAFLDQCAQTLADQLAQCMAYIAAWRKILRSTASGKRQRAAPSFVLHGFPYSLAHIGCLEVCNEAGIVTAGFQHGVAREISGNLINIESLYENSLVGNYFTYNQQCAMRSDQNRFAIAQSVAVGLPVDLVKGIGRADQGGDCPAILYPTTALYTCNMQLPGRACMNDLEKARFEIRMVKEVLDVLPHRVRYKPYNTDRYIDPDPITETVKNSSIEYYNRPIDLRYIVGAARVIIASRATSTVAWCIMSRRPLVFIDSPDQALSDNARRAFEDAFFYFDAREDTFFDVLRAFLSQPLEKIEALWREKASQRKDVLRDYIGDQSCRAGVRAGDQLLKKLKIQKALAS